MFASAGTLRTGTWPVLSCMAQMLLSCSCGRRQVGLLFRCRCHNAQWNGLLRALQGTMWSSCNALIGSRHPCGSFPTHAPACPLNGSRLLRIELASCHPSLATSARTVYCIGIFPILQTAPPLHLSSSLTLAGVYISPSRLLFDHLTKVVLEFLPASQVGSITCCPRDDKKKIFISILLRICVGHCWNVWVATVSEDIYLQRQVNM